MKEGCFKVKAAMAKAQAAKDKDKRDNEFV